MTPKSISEKIINFFGSCSIPPDIIEHRSAIEMFQAIRPNIQLPSIEELSQATKLVGGQTIEESPPPSKAANKTTFADVKEYIDEYLLSNSQAEGLLQLLNARFPDEILPEFPGDIKADEPGTG